jgi:iron complex transport system permease protein
LRLMVGSSYRRILPLSLIVGGGFLALTDLLARTLVSPSELPIGVVTAFFGAPFFLALLRTQRPAAA